MPVETKIIDSKELYSGELFVYVCCPKGAHADYISGFVEAKTNRTTEGVSNRQPCPNYPDQKQHVKVHFRGW